MLLFNTYVSLGAQSEVNMSIWNAGVLPGSVSVPGCLNALLKLFEDKTYKRKYAVRINVTCFLTVVCHVICLKQV